MSLAPQLATLATVIEQNPQAFVAANSLVRTAALDAAKFVFDLCMFKIKYSGPNLTVHHSALNSEQESKPPLVDLLSSLAPYNGPRTRSQTRKRKRSPSPVTDKPTFQTTPLTSLFVDGMSEDQIWEQLDLRTKNICQTLELILNGQGHGDEDSSTDLLGRMSGVTEDGEDVDFDAISDEDSLDQSDDDEGEEDADSQSDSENITEGVVGLHDSSSSEDGDEDDIPSSTLDLQRHNASLPKNRGSRSQSQLDDAFFSLASFNAETERAEAKSSSNGHLGGDEDSDDDDISIDLFAEVEHSHDQEGIGEEEAGGR
jgi:U3 small nucleolar RNA-associated protein MPP10